MKNLHSAIFLTLIGMLLVANGCKSHPSSEGEELTEIKFLQAPDSLKVTDAFKNISCVQLEMTEESVIGRIERVISTDENLIVFADNEIMLFNKTDGKFIRRIGSAGEGPEEYIEIIDISYNPVEKNVIAYDRMRNNLITYGLDGSFKGKTQPGVNFTWMASMERASDGTLLVCNCVSKHPPFDAFSIIKPDGKIEETDPFSPIAADNSVVVWASKPMSACGDGLKLVKMFTDSLFSVKNGVLSPKYKLDFGMTMPSKEMISQLGPFPGNPDYLAYCLSNNWLTGIDKVYETDGYIVMFPHIYQSEGIFWIDKRVDTGFKVRTTGLFDKEVKWVTEGKTIISIVGSNDKELISSFRADIATDSFQQALTESGKNSVFPVDVENAIDRLDPDGNPFLIIYSH